MATITDKIRKLNNDVQVINDGPGHAGIWVNDSGALMINVDGTPAEVGAGGEGGGESDQLDLRTSEPSGSADTVWVQHTGTSPTKVIALKVRISTVVYTVASVTV